MQLTAPGPQILLDMYAAVATLKNVKAKATEGEMAIMMKIDAWKALESVGVPAPLLNTLKSSGVEASVMPAKLVFQKGGEVLYSLPVKQDQWQSAIAGTLPKVAKASMHEMVVSAIKAIAKGGSALDEKKDFQIATAPAHGEEVKFTFTSPGTAKAPDKPSVKYVEAPAPKDGEYGVFDIAKMDTANRMHLAEATKLYQPVRATGEDSRYFLVAASAELRVAARYKEGSLSIRIEGPKINDYTQNLMEAGIGAPSKGYVSMHLVCPDKVSAGKAIGSVIMGLGLHVLTPMPQIDVIEGKGV